MFAKSHRARMRVPAAGTGACMLLIGAGIYELPSADGIPCTPRQLGTCIGLAESAR